MKFQIKIIDVTEAGNNGLNIVFQIRIVDGKQPLFLGQVEKQTIMRGDSLQFDLEKVIIFPGDG